MDQLLALLVKIPLPLLYIMLAIHGNNEHLFSWYGEFAGSVNSFSKTFAIKSLEAGELTFYELVVAN